MSIEKLMEMLNEDKVMRLAEESKNLEEVVHKLGLVVNEDNVDVICSIAPRVDMVFKASTAFENMTNCLRYGDKIGFMIWREDLIRALWLKKSSIEVDLKGIDENIVVEEEFFGEEFSLEWPEERSDKDSEEEMEVEVGEMMEATGEEKVIDMGDILRDDVHIQEMVSVPVMTIDVTAEASGGTKMQDNVVVESGNISTSGMTQVGVADEVPVTSVVEQTFEVRTEKKESGFKKFKRVPKLSEDNLVPLKDGDVECKVIAGDILGYTGEEYFGRKVVLVKKVPGRFGTAEMKREHTVRLTLHNGILNHMCIREGIADRYLTPYWAVLDAASDLKSSFTVEEVVSRAMITMENDGSLDACKTAWYVLKSHQTHPKERYRGMSFIVDDMGDRKFKIRGRKEEETQQSFDKIRKYKKTERAKKFASKEAKKKIDKKVDVPLATHIVSEAH